MAVGFHIIFQKIFSYYIKKNHQILAFDFDQNQYKIVHYNGVTYLLLADSEILITMNYFLINVLTH